MMQLSSPQVEAELSTVEPYSNCRFQGRIERQHLRLTQRQATMHNYNVGSFTALADTFARFSPNNITIQFPEPPTLPTYPPSNDDKEEAADSDN